MKIAAVSDLHGLRTRFALLGRLFDEGIDTLLIAGDVAASGDPSAQQADIRQNFASLLKRRAGVRIFAIPGNDDWAVEAVWGEGGRFALTKGPSTVLSVGPGNDPDTLYVLTLDLENRSFERIRLSRS